MPACAEAGILGALAGVVGSMMALEVIREIVGFGESLVGRLVMIDARAMRFETLRYAWDPANPLSASTRRSTICRGMRSARSPSPLPAEVKKSAAADLFAPRRQDGRAFEHRPFVVAGGKDREAFSLAPFQVVQKPSFDSFQVPSPLWPVPIGTRFILPSAANVILNLTLEGVAAVNGWPLKNVA